MTSSSRQVSYGTLSPPGCRSTLATWTSNRPPASSLYLHLLEASPLFTPPIILWYSLIFTSTTNNKGRDNDGNMTRTVKSVTNFVVLFQCEQSSKRECECRCILYLTVANYVLLLPCVTVLISSVIASALSPLSCHRSHLPIFHRKSRQWHYMPPLSFNEQSSSYNPNTHTPVSTYPN